MQRCVDKLKKGTEGSVPVDTVTWCKSIGNANDDFKEVVVPDELKNLYLEGMDERVESFRILKEIAEFGECSTRHIVQEE